MAIGLVNAGLMTLRQAIGVIMGANIGTTMTAFIVGIKIEEYALPIIAVGAFFYFSLTRKDSIYWPSDFWLWYPVPGVVDYGQWGEAA